ncbi:FAD-dependent monooxygenase [Spirosoma sp. KUDC1026]|uniref:FAD-dependent monooxygenase n=1 Tax=Spirosoma sp. KUDC1026 TaxID=2745947 RepID=UPI00159BD6BB|nr:FAD-dependent monooxygenase [Spirosoma sp. KUDC1026]QKZ12571.1 FAD-dependent monooxygenase [Spirosoma sp. KUDC1026]
MAARKVLISGASIAGPTLAYWLAKYGFDVTVVERAPSLRLGGQNIDVNGPARKVVRKMGIENAIREANTTEVGLQIIGQDGEVSGAFPKDGSVSGTRELEILRGDLVNILYNCSKESVDYRFGDFITALEQRPDDVQVTFESGKTETYQLVIAADGVRSRTRKLMFGDEPEFKSLGLYVSYMTIPRQENDNDWWRWYTAVDRRVLMLRPDNKGTIRASVAFLEDDKETYEKRTTQEQKDVLKTKLAGAGWEADRISKALDASDDLYLDKVGQIKAPRWSNGRVAMAGDAAYCPTPISGKGTTLAIVGSYILAGELARHERHEDAFAAYEKRLRPYVEQVQKLPPGTPRFVYPETKFGVSVLNTVAEIVASKPVQKVIGLFSSDDDEQEEEGIDLPDYR